jgi:hypothetical protein
MTRSNSPGVSLPTTSSAPVLGEEVESRHDGFRHALFGGPFGPSATKRDSERIAYDRHPTLDVIALSGAH